MVKAGPVGFDESADSRLALFGRIDAKRGTVIDQNVMFTGRFGGKSSVKRSWPHRLPKARFSAFRAEVGH